VAEPDVLANAGRWFDGEWYLTQNNDVARAGIDALAHYSRYGDAEGRFPSPWFDPSWYRSVYGVPLEQSALGHFLAHRRSGRYLPCAALFAAPHLTPSEDPFDTYLSGREAPGREIQPDLEVVQNSGLFDPLYFRINPVGQYEDELDPPVHYCRFGWKRGLRPNTAFDPGWYARTNPTTVKLGINPLTHYILEGEPANRRPVPWFDPAWYRSHHDVHPGDLALTHYLRQRHSRTVSPTRLFDVSWYLARHGASIPPEIDPFSHYLLAGALRDIDPSPEFDARSWRHLHMAPPSAKGQAELSIPERNPLVHYLSGRLSPQESGCEARPHPP
jgi:hypothetical protein